MDIYIYISSYLPGGRARKGLIRPAYPTPVTNSTLQTHLKRASNALQTFFKRISNTPQTHLKRTSNAPQTRLKRTSNAHQIIQIIENQRICKKSVLQSW